MTIEIGNPFELFTDTVGDPLEAGRIFIGTAGLDAETSQISVFFDEAGTIPAAQPIATIAGYPSNGGTPTKIYVNVDDYSITVQDKDLVDQYVSLSDNGEDPDALEGVKQFGTLAEARADAVAAGELWEISDRAGSTWATETGSGGNGFGKVDCTTVTTIQLVYKPVSHVSSLAIGAKGDKTTDDIGALDAGVALAKTDTGIFKLDKPSVGYKISSEWDISGDVSVIGAGIQYSIIFPDVGVLEAVTIGKTGILTGELNGWSIDREIFSGATENVGFAFYDMVGSSPTDLESRLSKYNIEIKSGNGQRVAYNSFINVQGIGGFYNLYWNATGTGYANENTFYGGRMFTTTDTDTNVHWNGGNHTRFVNMAAEGAGEQAFYLGGHSNVIEHPRTEGTWVVDDIVIDASGLRNFIVAHTLYTTITDNGTSTSFLTSSDGAKFSSSANGVNTAEFNYSGGSDADTVLFKSTRFNATSYQWRGMRTSDSFVSSSMSTSGILFVNQQLMTGGSGWPTPPLVLNNHYFWMDGNDFRGSIAAPTGAADGTLIATLT